MNRILAILRTRAVRIALAFLLTALLAGMLIVTIFWSRFDLQWLAFLGGVLFAAVLAIASQASKAEWLVLRRTRQLDRLKEQLSQEAARSRNAAEAMRMLESRFQVVGNALPSLILFVDRDQRCRFHNRAVERKTRLPGDQITGRLLRDVVGSAAYAGIAPRVADTLAGTAIEYETVWDSPGAENLAYSVRHVPYPPESAQPTGFYLLATARVRAPAPGQALAGAPPARAAAGTPGGATADGDALFVKFISDELTHWDDPRAGIIRALEEDQFLLFAQKILPLKADVPDPSCYEVLVRLKEEEENMLPPGNFIPIAERFGLMEQLDCWVVRTLTTWCMERRKRTPSWRVPVFCVNLSEAAVTSERFPRFVLDELQRTGFAAQSLCFEIAEQDAINRNSEVRKFAAGLKPAGCRFAIDAFGSVKVSFSHLRNLPIDFVKIDGAIVQDMLRDATALAKVRGINTVCQKVGIRTVAMFVETSGALDQLREIGVDYVQGFGISYPGPIDKIS
ncbi:MAG: EAL domain-containing protein [Betaproteobacteria bacterium]|nr:EAL domain-containing protein [Betaproteobacteria bacterium]